MTNGNNNFDYINANLKNIGNDIERYMAYLEKEGKTPGGLERTRSNLRIFFTYAPTTEPSEEQFRTAKKGLEDHGYVQKLKREILCSAGKFYRFRDKWDPYDLIRPGHNTNWYVVPETKIPFMEEIESFFDYLDGEPYSDDLRRRHKDHIIKSARILCYEKNITCAKDIDMDCFKILERYLDDCSRIIYTQVLYVTGLFVRIITGVKVYQGYRNNREVKNEFERSDQWNTFKSELNRYLDYLKERGYTEMSRRNLRTNLVTAFRRLFKICGPLYPAEIDEHHLRRMRTESTGLKEKTIKHSIGDIGRMVKFCTGKNPCDELGMYWSKQDEDRTWIFKKEWKLIYGSATTAERLALMLGAGMGLRRNEMATLKLSDIDGNIMTIHGKGHGRGKIVRKEIPKSVIAAIEDYLPERAELINRFGDRYGGCLFVPPYYSKGETTLYRYVGELVRTAASRAGVECTCHTLRRFYCTNLLDLGYELDVVKRMMRHSDIGTTLIYVVSDPRKLSSATASVDDALFG